MKNKHDKICPYIMSFGLVAITTLFGELVKKKIEPTNVIMFYLLVVIITAVRWGRGPAIATSILSVLAFDFFLVPPYLTLSVSDLQYIFTFTAFLVVGIVVSNFASKARERLIQRQTEKLHSALLNSISHDLKTPLVSITGSLTALLDSKSSLDEKGTRDLLETARHESGRLNRIVNNILDMTKMESGVLRIRKYPCDLKDLIGACLGQLKDKMDTRDVRIDIEKNFPEVALDFSIMLKAFYNIIENAFKYSPSDSPVEIRAYRIKDRVKVEIKDKGCGIAKEDFSRVFEKFYRIEKSQNVSGTGLGLCIARGIIEAHGGMISLESGLGKGSTFILELPLL